MTPMLLARWRRSAELGRELTSMRKMACGALIVAGAYVLLAAAASFAHASWIWLFAFFVVFTLGELYILPTGLGLFARLAPPALGATTIAGWFLAIFTGSMTAGVVGTFWSKTSHPAYFTILAAIAALAAALLFVLDRATRRVETARAGAILLEQP
jgi:POT family proton-dependent oligopeptide transporter